MAADVDTAMSTAAASIVVAALSLGGTWWTARRAAGAAREQAKLTTDLEQLKSRLTAENDLAKARRDYEYEARKRLYSELYPLVFQRHEAALAACNRVKNLARATRQGHLAAGPENWLGIGDDPYYFHSTLYSLLAPLAVHELMGRRLTLFDLNLDPHLRRQRFLAKRAYQCLRSDFDLADPTRYPALILDPASPARPYGPPEVTPDLRMEAVQERWAWRQGLYSGQVAQAIDALLVSEVDGGGTHLRVMSYPDFAKALGTEDLRADDPRSEMTRALRPMAQLLRDFHPARRPVTWRILIAQVCCYRAILAAATPDIGVADLRARASLSAEIDRREYSWMPQDDGATADQPVAEELLRAEIASAFETGNRLLEAALDEFDREHVTSSM